jgi:hypothetical protein
MEAISPRLERQGRDADRAPHIVQGLRMSGATPPLSHITREMQVTISCFKCYCYFNVLVIRI